MQIQTWWWQAALLNIISSSILCLLHAASALRATLCIGNPWFKNTFVLQWEAQHINYNFDVRQGKIFTEFFKGGQTNVCYNCLDRHIEEGRSDQTCFLWEGNDFGRDRKMTYREVLTEVCKVVSFQLPSIASPKPFQLRQERLECCLLLDSFCTCKQRSLLIKPPGAPETCQR